MTTNNLENIIYVSHHHLRHCFLKMTTFTDVAYCVISAEKQENDTSFLSVKSLLPKVILDPIAKFKLSIVTFHTMHRKYLIDTLLFDVCVAVEGANGHLFRSFNIHIFWVNMGYHKSFIHCVR